MNSDRAARSSSMVRWLVLIGWLAAVASAVASSTKPGTGVVVGPWVRHYAYDGLGRLIRAQEPWPVVSASSDRVKTQRYFYDGVRRIQEVHTEPLPAPAPGKEIELPLETELLNEGGQYSWQWAAVEYIWHAAGDSQVDELACVLDALNETAVYTIQDLSLDVVSVVAPGGSMLEQRSYDAYGEVLNVDGGSTAPVVKVGHKGLFFERFDQMATAPPVQAGAKGLYNALNRWYDPRVGRWTTEDPHGLAGPYLASAPFLAGRPPLYTLSLDIDGHYRDGLSHYGYVGANPTNRNDPLGLFFSMGDLMGSMTVRQGLQTGTKVYNAYETADGLLGAIRALMAGATAESVLVGLAFDVVADKAGGKAFDRLLEGAQAIKKRIGKNWTQTRNGYQSLGPDGTTPVPWTTAKTRYWKQFFGLDHPPRAKVRVLDPRNNRVKEMTVSMDLHHIRGRKVHDPHNPTNLKPVWPWEHSAIDADRHWGYELVEILSYE